MSNPSNPMFRTPPKNTEIYQLLMMVRKGGAIVSATISSQREIDTALAEGRLAVDKDGYGYIYHLLKP